MNGLSCEHVSSMKMWTAVQSSTREYCEHGHLPRDCGVRHARLGFRDAKRAPEMHGTKPFASRKPNLACRTRILLSRENSSLSLYI